MILNVLASSTDGLLVSLADTKEALDITDEGADEALTRFIRRGSSRIESYVGRPLLSQVYQAVVPSYGGQLLQLPRYPIGAVLRVFDGTDTGTATALSSTEYRTLASRGQLQRDAGWGWSYIAYPDVAPFPEPGQEYPRYLVEFSAGYIPANGKDVSATGDGTTTTGTTVPYDLQDAAIMVTRSMWLGKGREPGVTSKSVGELSISYSSAPTSGIPDEVAAMLQPYRSHV